ncbi:hypothetical protein C4N24_06645 [Faecalibacterium prausnitzii]|uniref:Uncharacterized protein n=1 Tax=Faecalibacterium prausnitzii TaxID=853 RepID=A0A329U7F8_9FIRM|nr:hypothetical protein C4N24_06645 [Faecalibacterium prausnitzii]
MQLDHLHAPIFVFVKKRLRAFLNLAFTEESAGKRTNMPSAFTTPPVKRQFGKIRRFSRTANYKIFFPLNMPRAQRRRPPPAAETGRSCWGSGQQDASAAQGTMRMLGAATR